MCNDGWRLFTCCKKTWQVHNTGIQCQKQPAGFIVFWIPLWIVSGIQPIYTVLYKCRVVMSIFSTSTTRNRMSAPNYLKVGGLISEIMVTTIVNVTTCMVMRVCLISNVETHTKFDSPITKWKHTAFDRLNPLATVYTTQDVSGTRMFCCIFVMREKR